MIRNGEASLDGAAERLRRAMDGLEARLAVQAARAAETRAETRAETEETLHIQLREARLRERALESAAAEASTVLGRAADRIRTALDEEDAALSEAAEDFEPEAANDEAPASLDHLSDDQTDMHPQSREF